MVGGWKRRSTCGEVMTHVDVDLEDFQTDQLLQELIDRKVITESQASALLAREAVSIEGDVIPQSELDAAREELARGRKTEALIHIERVLGSRWIGELSL